MGIGAHHAVGLTARWCSSPYCSKSIAHEAMWENVLQKHIDLRSVENAADPRCNLITTLGALQLHLYLVFVESQITTCMNFDVKRTLSLFALFSYLHSYGNIFWVWVTF